MSYSNIKLFIFLLLSSMTISSQAQEVASRDNIKENIATEKEKKKRKSSRSSSKTRREAEKIYNDLGYKTSLELYKKLSDEEKQDPEVLRRIANSYRLNDEPENAAYWYAKFIEQTSEKIDYLNFAKVLQSSGACEDAVRWYKKYASVDKSDARKNRDFISSCEEEKTFNDNNHIEIKDVKGLNSGHLDFSPIPVGRGVVFTSTRGITGMEKRTDKWTQDNFSDLFFAEKREDGSFINVKPLFGSVNGRYHDGTATFNKAGNMMFFTRNNSDGKSKDGLVDLKIYSAEKSKDGYWKNAEELPNINSDEYTTCHPTLSRDGKRLYFASNRPGGYGGLDIYVVDFYSGDWSEPRNLGPTVNTSDNEIFPFVAEDETLYFASKGHKGLGGLDIYMAQKTDSKDEGSWAIRENMGEKFNTSKDDFGFWINEEGNAGYLSSSRYEGNGGDDIYAWKADEGLLALGGVRKKMCVYEDGTDSRIAKAKVTIKEVSTDGQDDNLKLILKPIDTQKEEYVFSVAGREGSARLTKSVYSDDNGVFSHKVKSERLYQITSVKKGFEDAEIIVSYEDLMNSPEYCIPMKKRTCIMLEGLVVNKKYDKPMPGAEVRIENKCTGEEEKIIVAEDGAFEACIECGCEYRLHGLKSGFDSDVEFIFPKKEDCNPLVPIAAKLELGVRKIVKVEPTSEAEGVATPPQVRYVPKVTYVPRTVYEPVTTYVPAHEMTPEMLNEHFLGDPNASYREGTVITLRDIYYNFDKYNIRKDASIDLDRLLRLLNIYPSMHIALESHTDSRGSKRYNNRLSRKRAKSSRQYLIERGIDPSRITSKGFGESRLTNECADDVSCSEEEHQYNRRTEVRVTKFDRKDIQVEYENNRR